MTTTSTETESHQIATRMALSERIISEYQSGLLRFLQDRTGSLSEAEHLLWGPFLDAILSTRRATYSGIGSLRAWSYQVARNVLYDYLRAAKRERWTGLSNKQLAHPRSTNATKRPIWKQTAAGPRLRRLRRELEPKQQDVLFLRFDQDFSWNEVAEYLNDGPFQNEKDLQRASAAARKCFERAKRRLKTLFLQAREDGSEV